MEHKREIRNLKLFINVNKFVKITIAKGLRVKVLFTAIANDLSMLIKNFMCT